MSRSLYRWLLPVACSIVAAGSCLASPAAVSPADNAASTMPRTPPAPAAVLPEEAAVRKAMHSMDTNAKIDRVSASPVPGLMELNVGGDTVYMTADGKYLFSGRLIEVASKRDLTEASRAVSRRGALSALTASQMIAFAPSNPRYTVTVFTDVDCGYCRKFHSQIADYNKAGIAVDYVFFPRSGLGTAAYDKAVSVWCSADRRKALTDAKNGLVLPKATCANPVTTEYLLGLHVGVRGTPAVFAADGTQIGGYLTPTEMRARLDALEQRQAAL